MEPVDDLLKAAHTFLFSRDQQDNYQERRSFARDSLLERLLHPSETDNFRLDEKGNRYYDFDEPLLIGGKSYSALQAQRRVYSEIDLGGTEHLMRKLGKAFFDRVFRQVTIRQFDEDELYLLNQEGVVSDAELDELIIEKESWALVAVKS